MGNRISPGRDCTGLLHHFHKSLKKAQCGVNVKDGGWSKAWLITDMSISIASKQLQQQQRRPGFTTDSVVTLSRDVPTQ